jgi:hypothetical protein
MKDSEIQLQIQTTPFKEAHLARATGWQLQHYQAAAGTGDCCSFYDKGAVTGFHNNPEESATEPFGAPVVGSQRLRIRYTDIPSLECWAIGN